MPRKKKEPKVEVCAPEKNGGQSEEVKDDKAIIESFQKEADRITEWMLKNPEKVIQERKVFMQQLMKKRCCYGSHGGVLPITLSPLFLKQESLHLIADVAEQLDRIMDKLIRIYFEDEQMRSFCPYPDIPKEWIEWDPGYPKPTIVNRHDAIFDGKNLKFIEFNTDNPGGRGWHDIFVELFHDHSVYKEFIEKFAPPPERKMLKALKDTLLTCYREWGGTKERPRIGLTSFKQFWGGSDDEIVRDYLIEQGIESNLVDARDFEYKNGALSAGNVTYDILNLTLRFTYFKRFPREMKDFMDALRDKKICCVNHFRATLAAHKESLAFLTNDENHHYFTPEEVECIKKYLPWTRKMDETVTISCEGTDVALQEYTLKNQEKLVLKPSAGAGGYEVHVGKVTPKDKWQEAVENAIGCPWWVVQEAVEIPEYEFPVLKQNKVVMEKKNLNLSPYIFHGKYAGCLGRISDSKVINVSAGGGIIPVFPLKGRKEQ